MSADLVTQLRQDAQAQRDAAPEGAALWVADRFDQAADEIERLQRRGAFSGNADNVDFKDIAAAGRAYADNLLKEPAITEVMHRMADEIEQLREAIRRLADQDAAVSVCNGNATVTMDATLTDAEREAVEWCVEMAVLHATECEDEIAALRGLLKRTKEAAHMNDENERSVASAGSVAGDLRNGAPSGCGTVRYDRGPVAWAVMPRNSDYCVTLSTRREAAQKAAERKVEVGEYATMDDIAVVPLYRQPQDGVVRLPPLDPNGAPGWNAAIGAVREALAEAGVDWDTE